MDEHDVVGERSKIDRGEYEVGRELGQVNIGSRDDDAQVQLVAEHGFDSFAQDDVEVVIVRAHEGGGEPDFALRLTLEV